MKRKAVAPPTAARLSVAVCLLTRDRPDEVLAAIESVGAGADSIRVLENGPLRPMAPVEGVSWATRAENAGVCGGRNLLAEEASEDILLFLDDDAVAVSPIVEVVRERFAREPDLGLIAFRISRSDGRTVAAEIPFRGSNPDPLADRECAYFLGGACAVRRSAFIAAGGYDDRYFYSTEEMDLGLKLIKAGWRLQYVPEAHIEHRPSAHGREISPAVPAFVARNRVLYARQHLSWPFGTVHVLAWFARTLPESVRARGLRRWCREVGSGLKLPVERSPLSLREHLRLHRIGGRILY